MSNIELIIVTFVEVASIILIWAALEPKITKNKWKLLLVLTLITASTNMVSQYDISYAALLRLMISFVIVWGVIRLPFSEMLVSYVTSILLVGLTQLTVIMLMVLTGISQENMGFEMTLATNILLLSCAYILYRFIAFRRLKELLRRNNKAIYYSLVNLIFLMILILITWDTDKIFIIDAIYVIIVGFVMWAIVNVVMVLQHVAYKDKEKQLAVHEDYLPIIDSLVDEVRSIQHDHHHHLHTIYGLCEVESTDNSKEDIMKYLDQVIDINRKSNKLISLNDKFLAALLYSKMKVASQKEVSLDIRIKRQPEFMIPSYKLVELVGNLIDNSIDATEKILTEKRENIVVVFDEISDKGIVSISNQLPKGSAINISKMFKVGYTTKQQQGHGYGLKKVVDILNEANGKVQCEVEDGRIDFVVELPIREYNVFNE